MKYPIRKRAPSRSPPIAGLKQSEHFILSKKKDLDSSSNLVNAITKGTHINPRNRNRINENGFNRVLMS